MKYKSEIYEVVHQDAMANFEVGAISEAQMREFDKMCLAQEGDLAVHPVKNPNPIHEELVSSASSF